MHKLDALLHWADYRSGAGNNIVLLKPELFAIWALKGLVIQGEEVFVLADT